MSATHDPNHIIYTGGNPVLAVLQQMAGYDEVEHEGKLADIIRANIGDAVPTTTDVLYALLTLLEDMSKGRDTCITVHALGDLHYPQQGLHAYDRDLPVTIEEQEAVRQAELYAGELARALRAIICRDKHGTNESYV